MWGEGQRGRKFMNSFSILRANQTKNKFLKAELETDTSLGGRERELSWTWGDLQIARRKCGRWRCLGLCRSQRPEAVDFQGLEVVVRGSTGRVGLRAISRLRPQGRLSYREATAGTESVPLYLWGVHRGGRVGSLASEFCLRLPERLGVAKSPPACSFQDVVGTGGWVLSFPGPDVGQWIASVFLWPSVLPSTAWSLWCPSTTPEEGQEGLDICTWQVALSSPPGSVAEGSTGGKHGKKLDLESWTPGCPAV